MNIEEEIGELLAEKNLTISVAESCTGGLVSSLLTDISGSSKYIKLNLVTYSNNAKNKMLGVDWEILNNYGAVSEECAMAMVEGLHRLTDCDIAICTTGIAGPTGGTIEKPVGLMYIGLKYNNILSTKKILLPSNICRIDMKKKFAQLTLEYALMVLKDNRLA